MILLHWCRSQVFTVITITLAGLKHTVDQTHFRVKIVHGKILSSLGVSDNEIFQQQIIFKVKLFVPLLTNLLHDIHNHAQL